MLFDEPPAPAARIELGFEMVLLVAHCLTTRVVQCSSSLHTTHDDLPNGAGAGWYGDCEAERPIGGVLELRIRL